MLAFVTYTHANFVYLRIASLNLVNKLLGLLLIPRTEQAKINCVHIFLSIFCHDGAYPLETVSA